MKIRLLKMGDLIAVPIRAEDARLIDGFGEGGEDNEDKVEELREMLLNQEYVTTLFARAFNHSCMISPSCSLNCKVPSCLEYRYRCCFLQDH